MLTKSKNVKKETAIISSMKYVVEIIAHPDVPHHVRPCDVPLVRPVRAAQGPLRVHDLQVGWGVGLLSVFLDMFLVHGF